SCANMAQGLLGRANVGLSLPMLSSRRPLLSRVNAVTAYSVMGCPRAGDRLRPNDFLERLNRPQMFQPLVTNFCPLQPDHLKVPEVLEASQFFICYPAVAKIYLDDRFPRFRFFSRGFPAAVLNSGDSLIF